jgi:hypothetical protein
MLDEEWGFTQIEDFDAYGIPVTLFEASGYHWYDNTETVHVDLTSAFQHPTLCDAMRYLLTSFTTLGNAGLNDELFGLAESKIGASDVNILINGSGEDSGAKAIDYVENELLRGFPMVSMAFAMGGYGPVVTDHRSTLIRANLTAGQYPLRGDRVSDVVESAKSTLFNNFTLSYDYNVITNEYAKVIVRDPSNNDMCALSRELIGDRHMSPVEVQQYNDAQVAEYVAGWMVAHYALPSYYVEYPAYPWVFFFLRLGDNVTFTESEFDWSEVSATVERIRYSRGDCVLGMRIWAPFYATFGGASAGQAQ